MNLAFTEEQEALRRSLRRFLADRSPETEVRRLMASEAGYDPAVWAAMADQLGLQAMAVPEEYGGAGFSFVELVVAMEEMGRALTCAPFFSSVVLAATTVLSSGDEAFKKEVLPAIASGELRATLALTEQAGRWDEAGVTCLARRDATDSTEAARAAGSAETGGAARAAEAGGAGGWRLDGAKSFVIDGHTADLLLVAARIDPGGAVSLFAVDRAAPGLSRQVMPTMDQTRKMATVELVSVPARLVGTEGEGWAAVSRALDFAAVALAAEQVGGAQRVLEMSVEYAKVRVQFGRPIGSFQAVKHRCADMLMAVESAKSAAYYAAWAAAEDNDELPVMASLAKAYCSEAYFQAAADNIQIHGGIGFTWDHPAHLYFKRAKSSELILGDPAYHRELVAQRIGI